MECSPVLVFLLLLMSTCDCQNHVFYIRPSDSSHCPQEVNTSQCYDLTTLVSEECLSTALNISLLFLPGQHFLEYDLNVTNAKEFQMKFYYDEQSIRSVNGVKIDCSGYSNHGVRVQNVSLVKINSINFQSCGVELMSVDHSEITDCKWNESRSSAISIQDSNSVISDCQFMNGNCHDCSGGGIFAVSSNVNFTGSNNITNNSVEWPHYGGGLSIRDSYVLVDGNLTINSNWASGTLISIYLLSSGGGMYATDSIFETTNTGLLLFENNFADDGGGLFTSASTNTFNGQVEFIGNSAGGVGGGMAVWAGSHSSFNENVKFHGNSAGEQGGGLMAWDSCHNTFNENVKFSGNNAGINGGGMALRNSHSTFDKHVEFSGNKANSTGGGILVWANSHSTFNEHVEFSGNRAEGYGGGIAVYAGSRSTFNKHVDFSGNSAGSDGGGMSIEYDSYSTFNQHVEFYGNSAIYGGGMRVFEGSQCIFNGSALFLGNSAENSGGSLLIHEESSITFLSVVVISNSTAGWEGGGIFVREDSLLEMSGETIIKDNYASSYGGGISLDFSELRLKGTSEITSNSAQYGGAIQVVSSNMHIVSGDHCFENNSAQYGGGMALSGGSSVVFPYEVHQFQVELYGVSYFMLRLNIYFISNSAEQYGGAIWVESTTYYSCISKRTNPRCFLRGDYFTELSGAWFDPPRIIAINNTAAIAGSNIHGGNLDSCSNDIEPLLLNNPLFESSVSSDPYRVCLCKNNELDCSKSHHSIEIFSGQQFQLSLVGVGQRNSTVPAVILSHTDPLQSSNDGSVTQSAPGNCKEFSYTISSDKISVKFMLYPESMCPITSLEMLTINVKIKPCPPGFMLNNQTKSCMCDTNLMKLDDVIQCDINSQSFSHQHGVWIGYDQLNDLNETVIYHPHCPFDYCTEFSNFTLKNSNDQCRYNRSGFICGACSEGYSLTLGGSQCKECSHVYLVLFIPLALAGVVLVLFLLTLKLTVSIGTINGLIFFANIVETNSSIFLPPESTVVLRVFIAWLNLDLGINTCLFDELDMYIKVWLQFVFPFYVFILIGIIIFVSHRSTLVTKLLGSDPIAVLATLILVAYTKLLRAVLTVMSFTYIRGFDGSSIAVWLYDGNVRYMSGKHIALVLFALLITLLLIIPYTAILLLAPYLQRYSNNRVLFWINDYRLKAFLHSYYAPLKDKYRSWIGVLLVLRLCLLIVFVFNSLGDPSINLYAVVVVVILLFSWRMLSGTVYTNWYLDALEIFFLMNLGLFSVSTLFVRNTSGYQRALADTLVSVAFIIFLAITVYHVWRQLTDSRWWRLTLKPKWQKYAKKGVQKDDEAGPPLPRPQVPTTVIELQHLQVSTTSAELREPVLEYC